MNGSENQAIRVISRRTVKHGTDARKYCFQRYKMENITLICVAPLSRAKINAQNYLEADITKFLKQV